MKREPVDVVVVGAGMGGAAFCARLSERAPHLRIVCLERGGWVDTAAMPPWRRDWQRATMNEWASSPNLRLKAPTALALRRLSDRRLGIAVQAADVERRRRLDHQLGGAFPAPASVGFPDADARRRRRRLAVRLFRSRALLRSQRRHHGRRAASPAIPPIRRSRRAPCRRWRSAASGRRRRAASTRSAGIGGRSMPPSTPSRIDGRAACNYCGPCQHGCVIRAKSSADVTYWPRAIASWRRAADRLHRAAGRDRRRPRHGRRLSRRRGARDARSRPAAVVVAGNGIGTARLLLASGLDSPALGRNLMFHPGRLCARHVQGASSTGRSGRSAARSTATNSTRPTSGAASSAACICR